MILESEAGRAELLALYDRELRQDAPYFDPEVTVERDGTVVRLLGATADPGNNSVLFAAPSEKDAEAVVDRQIAYFRTLCRGFEWKWHGHDRPAMIRSILLAKGFEPAGDERVVALDLDDPRPSTALPAGYEVREWPSERSLEELMAVQTAVWAGEDLGWLGESLERERRSNPSGIRFHAVYHGKIPVSVGWTRRHGPFASLFGGSTLPEHRGRGLYKALVAARLEVAAGGGARYALVDAGPMSWPILERLGFTTLTETAPLVRKM